MSYVISPAVLGSMFAVPANVVDEYIKLSGALQLKTMLWIFRHAYEPIDPIKISENTGYSVENIIDALVTLCEWGVLTDDGKAQSVPAPEKKEAAKPTAALPEIAPVKPTYEQVLARCKESPEIANMFKDIQEILGKTIGYDSECVFIMMHDQYGLPVEVIYMLVSHCVSVGKGNMSYIAKVGRSWGEQEIDTIEKADEQIKILNSCQKIWKEFSSMAGIQNPRPSSSQSAFLRTWTQEMKFGVDMIFLAYEEMLDHSSRLSFPYMNKVLANWHAKGLKTPQDVEADKQSFRKANADKNKSSSSYSMEEFNRRADKLPVYKKGG